MPSSSRTEIGRCMCGAKVAEDSFRDIDSYREFFRTGRGLCQACQDRIFLATDPDDPRRRLPLVNGALAAVRVGEICLLPFRLVARPRALIVWEARFTVRAGPALEPLDPWDELDPMRELLTGHQVRVHEHPSLDAPGLAERLFRLGLLIALDRQALDRVLAMWPLPQPVSRASLADGVPWQDAFSRPLRPLATWWWPEQDVPSALRECALMGRVLLQRARDGRRALELLATSRKALFSPAAPRASRTTPEGKLP